ncbi:metal ABC transporter substrate-binding protein [Isobaculum melis]|uniref:Zinc transport system substrate-binding protein n=1 Tax=Isobaculum melis TaxID=142588 RepID=A0A1H9SLR5_9LACT|nr:metal ABC transporter substrate-binding protein [Isobaculum melis]SER85950.1 zinc transport system substrate-binding protein [Isobaculum melis]
MKKITGLMALLLIVLVTIAGCSTSNKTEKKTGVEVVTTFYPMYDFTKNVVGDKGEVTMLMPAGTEPHDYEPSAKDIAKILEADVFVYNSEALETWIPNVLENIDQKKTVVIDASKGIAVLEGTEEDDHDDHEGHDHNHEYDPHIWLDPVNAQKQVENIKTGLIEADEKNQESYEKNATDYTGKLVALDEQFSSALKDAKNRTFVTQHAAFSYLAKRYQLEQVAISGVSPDQEPSPARLAELSDFVKEHQIHVIYFEEIASPKIAKTLANETGVELEVLNPIEGITKEDQDQGMDYISSMEKNLKALQKSIH